MDEKTFPGWDRIEDFPLSSTENEAAFNAVMTRARRIENRIHQAEKHKRAKTVRRVILLAAASAAAIILPTVYFTTGSNSVEQNGKAVAQAVKMVQRSTGRGEISDVVLPDQSRVTLNAESVLIYPESFEAGRSVFLSGEAVFDVTASEKDPFLVETADITVRVHGTRFNVQAYFDDRQVTATLCRGSVTAWSNESPECTVELESNNRFSYDRATHAVTTEKVNSLEAVAWENGDLCFSSAGIHDIIRTLQRRFGVSVYLTSQKYDQAVITAHFIHGETLGDLLDALCAIIPGMRYSIKGDSVYLK